MNTATPAPPRPRHVIWIMGDQWRAEAVGFAGNRLVRTPNLDRLAAAGTVFDQMYVQCPVCLGSRACQFTGRYLQNLRMANGCPVLDPWEPTLPTLLQRAGYRTGLFGKLHLTPQQYTLDTLKTDRPVTDAAPFLGPAGFAAPMPTDPTQQRYGFQEATAIEDALWGEYLAWLVARAPDLAARLPLADWRAGRVDARRVCQQAFWRSEFPGTPLADVGASDLPWELHPSLFIGDSAADFFRRRHAEGPVFAFVSFVDPHHPFDPPRDVARDYPADAMPLPRHRDRALAWPPSLRGRTGDFRAVSDHHARTTVGYYYAMIDVMDRAIGRVLAAVEAAGELENTVFVLSADHGELLGDHGLWRKGSYHYDCMLRSPAFIAAPGLLPAGRRVAGLTQTIDLAPTILDLVGLPPAAGMQGDNLAPALRAGGAGIGREWVFCDMYTAMWGPFVSCWSVRTATAKLNYYPQDRVGHVLNLADDPDELRDLWGDPAGRALRDELLATLLQARHAQTDPLPRMITQY